MKTETPIESLEGILRLQEEKLNNYISNLAHHKKMVQETEVTIPQQKKLIEELKSSIKVLLAVVPKT